EPDASTPGSLPFEGRPIDVLMGRHPYARVGGSGTSRNAEAAGDVGIRENGQGPDLSSKVGDPVERAPDRQRLRGDEAAAHPVFNEGDVEDVARAETVRDAGAAGVRSIA